MKAIAVTWLELVIKKKLEKKITRFNPGSQWVADQARVKFKKGSFFVYMILQIYQLVNREESEEGPNKRTEMVNSVMQDPPLTELKSKINKTEIFHNQTPENKC